MKKLVAVFLSAGIKTNIIEEDDLKRYHKNIIRYFVNYFELFNIKIENLEYFLFKKVKNFEIDLIFKFAAYYKNKKYNIILFLEHKRKSEKAFVQVVRDVLQYIGSADIICGYALIRGEILPVCALTRKYLLLKHPKKLLLEIDKIKNNKLEEIFRK